MVASAAAGVPVAAMGSPRTMSGRASAPADSDAPAPPAAVAACGAPHSPQNFIPGGFWNPQAGQPDARRVPHSPQNFMPAGFWCPHAGQVTCTSPKLVETRA